MKDKKIYIPARKVAPNEQGVIKITPEAMEILVEIVNNSSLSMRQAVSTIIIQAYENNLIRFSREDMNRDENKKK